MSSTLWTARSLTGPSGARCAAGLAEGCSPACDLATTWPSVARAGASGCEGRTGALAHGPRGRVPAAVARRRPCDDRHRGEQPAGLGPCGRRALGNRRVVLGADELLAPARADAQAGLGCFDAAAGGAPPCRDALDRVVGGGRRDPSGRRRGRQERARVVLPGAPETLAGARWEVGVRDPVHEAGQPGDLRAI